MAHVVRLQITPDRPNAFGPDSFDHLLQSQIIMPGLDRTWCHTLIGAQVAEDGNSADLSVLSDPPAPTRLAGLQVLNGTPPARVRVMDADGQLLIADTREAPLRMGQRVAYDGREYVVTGEHWPHRDPETGVCRDRVDWQHAHVAEVAAVVSVPVAAEPGAWPPAATVEAGPAATGSPRTPRGR